MPVGNWQYRRSPSLASQDSFGGPISQDPAELYLASAKQFNMPLSDLGETPTQEVIHSPTDPGMTLPDASEHQEFLAAAMRKYEEQRANRTTSNRRANILVAATPSNSDESSGMSQNKDDEFSFTSRGPGFTGHGSRFEFDGSSSFDKMLDRDLADVPDPTPEPTQPKETRSAQLDDIVDVKPSARDDFPTPPRSSEQHSPSFEWIAPTPSATIASSNPRSLLRMVHPGNQYRIAKMRNLAGAVEPPSFITKGAETQPSCIEEETQLCHVEEPTCSNAAPRQTRMGCSRPDTCQPQKGNEDDEIQDALDVVPDSEPLRAELSTRTPSHHRTTRQSSPKKPFRSFSPISEHGSGDLVPGSLEAEESEADIPLAIEVASRDVKRSMAPTEGVVVHCRKTKTASAVPAKVICIMRFITIGG